MERQAGIENDTLAGYPQTMRDVALEMDVPLIDLHAMSKQLYTVGGADIDQAFVDGTHHTSYGSYQLGRCVVAGIRDLVPDLAVHLKSDVPPIDLASPDSPATWTLPPSPLRDLTR